MRRNGFNNKSNNNKPMIKLLIPIIITIFLFSIINILTNFFFSGMSGTPSLLAAFLTDFNDWSMDNAAEYLIENYYFLFPLSVLFQSLLYVFFMILGFNKGYKKREKERQELLLKKNIL